MIPLKFGRVSKRVLMPPKYFFFIKKNCFFMIPLKFGRVSSTFLIFRNFTVVPPLQVQVTPVVPPLVLDENF